MKESSDDQREIGFARDGAVGQSDATADVCMDHIVMSAGHVGSNVTTNQRAVSIVGWSAGLLIGAALWTGIYFLLT